MLLSIMKLLVTKLNSWLKSTLLCVPRVKSIQTFQKLIMIFPFCILYFIIMIFIIILYLKNDSVSRWIIWVSLFYISFRVIFVIILTFKCTYSTQLYCIFSIFFFCISIINIIITIILFIFYIKYLSGENYLNASNQYLIIWNKFSHRKT